MRLARIRVCDREELASIHGAQLAAHTRACMTMRVSGASDTSLGDAALLGLRLAATPESIEHHGIGGAAAAAFSRAATFDCRSSHCFSLSASLLAISDAAESLAAASTALAAEPSAALPLAAAAFHAAAAAPPGAYEDAELERGAADGVPHGRLVRPTAAGAA